MEIGLRRAQNVSDSATSKGRPVSASGVLTGAAGVIAALASAAIFRDWSADSITKVLTVLGCAAAGMIAVDVLIYRVQDNTTTGLSRAPLRPLDLPRVARKFLGLWLTIGVIAALYFLIPEYHNDFYEPFTAAAFRLLPALLVASPFYIAYVDCRQREPVDAYAQVAMLIGGNRPEDWGALKTHVLGWLVKAFFLPLMFVYVHNDMGALWNASIPAPTDFEHFFSWLIDLFYLVDVLIATVTYAITLRLIDNHIRSVEPTLGGWIICVICYRPLTDVQAPYIQYEQDNLYWGAVFAPYPWLYVIWGSMILGLVFIYAWSTASFGLRFSNLTNRGIITDGPYRWLKHPAYVSKNLSWWMISVPFIAGAGWVTAVVSCIMMAAVNLIYYLRAKTEERHLRADPAYREYEAYIARCGLWALLLNRRRGS
ncbi:MAG: isoprenylcysteine carboxylmethyltransferase family protein [Hyphomicrobiales bacterium]